MNFASISHKVVAVLLCLIPYLSAYTFQWSSRSQSTSSSIVEDFVQSATSNDIYYIITGDTQFWHTCTLDNDGCYDEVHCYLEGKSEDVKACEKQHGEYMNRVQQASMKALKDLMQMAINRVPSGLIVNGDLTEYGHDAELTRFKSMWNDWTEIKLYPGLGNHDYANNVDDCAFQHCANRMLKYFKSYVTETLKLDMDIRERKKNFVQSSYVGSLAYSWDECSQDGKCVHFVQLNNHPTYKRNIDSPFNEWKVLPSLNFLKVDLTKNSDKPIVINFHDFDNDFKESDKKTFQSILKESKESKVVAVFFAHFHASHGIRETWCINGRLVPLVYSGSVPGNNYVLVQFSAESMKMKNVYKIHAANEDESTVEKILLRQYC